MKKYGNLLFMVELLRREVDNHPMNQTFIDETYFFQCTCCGDCCTGSMEININIYDLYKISRYMKLESTGELFKKGLVKLVQVQNKSWTPQIVFKTSPYTFCPWLINDLGDDDVLRGFCSLHPYHKPLICRMAPAGREIDFDDGSIAYVLTPPTENCPGMESKHTNRLSQLKGELKKELDFEYRYYQILDRIQNKEISEEMMLSEYYTFTIERDFEEILSEIEKRSEIFIR